MHAVVRKQPTRVSKNLIEEVSILSRMGCVYMFNYALQHRLKRFLGYNASYRNFLSFGRRLIAVDSFRKLTTYSVINNFLTQTHRTLKPSSYTPTCIRVEISARRPATVIFFVVFPQFFKINAGIV